MNAIAAIQDPSSHSYSGQIAWIPTQSLGKGWGLRAELGLTVFVNRLKDPFPALNYELYVTRELFAFSLEGGGGMSSWLGNGGTWPIVSAVLCSPGFWFFDGIWGGFSRFLLKKNEANEFRVGVRFQW